MISFLARTFIPNYQKTEDPVTRRAYGALSGAVGIFLNLLLFIGKFIAGTLSGSVSITADAFNNLSDAASCIVTLFGFKLAGQAPDQKHPFGHGRFEYLTGLLVSIFILLMGLELAKSSVAHILSPSGAKLTPLVAGILVASIAVKFYMFLYNRSLSKFIDSVALSSVAKDSISDVIATLTVLICQIITLITGLNIDGFCGLAVSCFILRAGVVSAFETMDPLLGEAPSDELKEAITKAVNSDSRILGMHDLIIHDYGPGMRMTSLHVEIPSDMTLVDAHEIVDEMELRLQKQFDIDCVIHVDPINQKDAEASLLQHQVLSYLQTIDEGASIHDFRLVRSTGHTKVLFDAVVSYKLPCSDEELLAALKTFLTDRNPAYRPIIHLDKI